MSSDAPRRVLIVEDDDAVRELLLVVCRDEGYDVVDTTNGVDALALARSEAPDLVLLDWGLPDMTGIDVIRQLRATGVDVPIVMLTGRTEEADVEAGLRAGADDYLTKPVTPRALAARLGAHLRRSARDAGGADSGELKTNASVLAQVSIFFLAPPATLRSLAGRSTRLSVAASQVVFAEGASNETLYVIMKGHFRVSAESSSGHATPVAMLGPADFFGATSLLTRRSTAASVSSLEAGILLLIGRDDLLRALPAESPGRLELSKVIAQRQALLQGAATRVGHAASDRARMISIYSPKGGVGRTTIALNLTASIAKAHRGDVLLLDLALPYNHGALLAGLAPSTSLARLWDVSDRFEDLLESAVVYHPDGFLVLSSALTPEEADLMSAPLLERAINVLRRQFSYIVVDLGSVPSEPVLAILEASDHVVLVAVPEFSMMKDLIQVKRILQDVLHVAIGRIHLVVNHRNGSYRLGRREIETVVGMSVESEIRFDGQKPEEAALQGQILVLSDPTDPFAKATAGLARSLTARS